jgi:hypothetical protein
LATPKLPLPMSLIISNLALLMSMLWERIASCCVGARLKASPSVLQFCLDLGLQMQQVNVSWRGRKATSTCRFYFIKNLGMADTRQKASCEEECSGSHLNSPCRWSNRSSHNRSMGPCLLRHKVLLSLDSVMYNLTTKFAESMHRAVLFSRRHSCPPC